MTKEELFASQQIQLARSSDYVPGIYKPQEYSVCPRDYDYHHFDIFAQRRPGYVKWFYDNNPDAFVPHISDFEKERAFAIRGEPGKTFVRDERWDPIRPMPRPNLEFEDAEAALSWIIRELTGQVEDTENDKLAA
jgi:hypothetical protein